METVGPNGFYNEWADSGNYYVDFDISTDRIYKATGDDNENGMDTLVIGEDYWNEETLGKLTIRKTGNALTGKIETNDLIDPWMTGEADSDFAYRPVRNTPLRLPRTSTRRTASWMPTAAARSGMPRAMW